MLDRKRAIITGGSRGLGKEIAREYVRQGADICICSRNADELGEALDEIKKAAVRKDQIIIGNIADIGNCDDIDNLFRFSINRFGGLDVLVNNAGIQGPIGRIEEQDWEKFREVINVNMLGSVYCMKKAISHFKSTKERYDRCIISISGGGATGARPLFLGYALSKTGIVRATETLAKETEGFGIRMNCIAPGAMNTKMTEEILSAGEEAGEEYAKTLRQKDSGGVSLNNAARLAVFLASDEASGINGRLLSAVWDDWGNLGIHKREIEESDVYTLRRIIPADRGFRWE